MNLENSRGNIFEVEQVNVESSFSGSAADQAEQVSVGTTAAWQTAATETSCWFLKNTDFAKARLVAREFCMNYLQNKLPRS